ncbi:glycerol-3-phosphate 1-O-acyltransferase PlsY [Pusillimonas sp. CC-YST705]|uniref:Glycerol-3-phosphate acyltransferase n=1 Tax=Mesopusillimonas faecipullorum TaxID=2755040 RepID=A0ABS8CB02_9BURK|nr:glycerol-3-phosphate 1-O-acyltransferase PlsY [Mesopusillimonas faecipullorum]MCB5363188.1 glycerol-3-phosphate 1-O-acyltransferase PlsY [Mesopusillimonas faecipullorum]
MSAFPPALAGSGLLLLAYLIGSLPFAVIVSQAMGLADPRSYGSGNPGATNVLRTGNKLAAALTLLGDAAKGVLAVCLARWAIDTWQLPSVLLGACAVAVFLGHLFPVFLKFKGGKGVATALGVVLALQPWLGVACAATWLIVARASGYSSLAAIAAAVFTPLYYIFGGGAAWRFDGAICFALVVIALLLCVRHRANIERLLQGKESRIGGKRKKS